MKPNEEEWTCKTQRDSLWNAGGEETLHLK